MFPRAKTTSIKHRHANMVTAVMDHCWAFLGMTTVAVESDKPMRGCVVVKGVGERTCCRDLDLPEKQAMPRRLICQEERSAFTLATTLNMRSDHSMTKTWRDGGPAQTRQGGIHSGGGNFRNLAFWRRRIIHSLKKKAYIKKDENRYLPSTDAALSLINLRYQSSSLRELVRLGRSPERHLGRW